MRDSESSSSLLGTSIPGREERNARKLLPVSLIAPILLASALLAVIFYVHTCPTRTQQHSYDELQRSSQEKLEGALVSFYPDVGMIAMSGFSVADAKNRQGRNVLQVRISSICKRTAFPDVCGMELSGLHIRRGLTSLEMASFALRAAARHIDQGYSLAINCSAKKGISLLEHQCASDCVELLLGARDQLKLAADRLSGLRGVSDPAFLHRALVDVKVWLSSSLSYQTACSDNFDVAPGSIQHQIWTSHTQLTRVLGVCLDLVDILSRVGNSLDSLRLEDDLPNSASATPAHSRRRLLNEAADAAFSADHEPLHIEDSDDFPRWVSTEDRKLLQSSSSTVAADAVVASDGSGDYTNVTAAVNAIPSSFSGRYVIYIKAGLYDEVLNLTKDHKNVTFIGDGIGRSVITGNRNVASGEYNTYRTSTVGVAGNGFFAVNITFRNTAGPDGHQAVALRAQADYLVFYRCSFEGFQDTLYALSGRQFYRECQIFGTVDFIFGNAVAVFQNCALWARKPKKGQKNIYTAQGRQLAVDITGYSFHNCALMADASLMNSEYTVETYLGRPWKEYSRTVFLQSELQDLVQPEGWLPWNASNPFTDTVYYGEYGNRGAGANTSQRVSWAGVHPKMSQSDASNFTLGNFLGLQSWLDVLQDVPYQVNLM